MRPLLPLLLPLAVVSGQSLAAPVLQSGGPFMSTPFCVTYGCEWLGREELLSQGRPSGVVEYVYRLREVPQARVVIWRDKASNAVSHVILWFRPAGAALNAQRLPVNIAGAFVRDVTGYEGWRSVPVRLMALCPRGTSGTPEVFALPGGVATCSFSAESYDEAGRPAGSQLTLMIDPVR